MTVITTPPPAAASVAPPTAPIPVLLKLTQWDGTPMSYRAWLPASGAARRAVILFHRGHEHSGRFEDVVPHVLPRDDGQTAAFAWDARGHGLTPGERGYAPPIRGMVLVTPALRVKLYVPLAIPSLRAMQAMRRGGTGYVKSYVRAGMLTHDAEQARRYESDPLIARNIAVNILLDLHDTATRLIDDAGAITTPTLVLGAGSDWVVKLSAQRQFFERLSSPVKRMHVFDGAYHDLLHEKDRGPVLEMIRGFVGERFAQPTATPSLLDAHKAGYTKSEYDALCKPLPPSFKRLSFAVQRGWLKTVGKVSRGVRIGWATGFDSGQSLDYVYGNRAHGFTPLGKAFDRFYLNAIGWRGIRQRRVNLEALLKRAIEETHAAGEPVRIVDIAAGGGRYVLCTVAEMKHVPVSVLLRDRDPRNLDAAKRLAGSLGLSNVTSEPGDAFDEASLAAIDPAPTIAIVSGLYELFPDNDIVLRSLRGLRRAMRGGGLLIYTGQPWHPQVEMIARVLTNRDGQRWIMRRRTQAEMDALVRAAGFEKAAMEIDDFGIFTVSLARTPCPRK